MFSIFKKKSIYKVSDFCREVARKSKLGRTYTRKYNRLARAIEDYEEHSGLIMSDLSLNDQIVEDFIYYLKGSSPEKKNHLAYRISTIEGFYNSLITICRKMSKQGIKIQCSFDIRFKEEDCATVYLSQGEIDRLNNLKLNRESSQVRDLFLVGCCTALRYSDYTRLSEDNFKNDTISVLTKKTDTRVVIPTHHIIREIIKRNNGYDFLNYKKSQQNFNKVIKRISKRAGINEKVTIERTEGFKKVKRVYKKYQLISSHTARRSGATNMYLAGIPPFRIMLITGHKTESSFYRYIRIQKEENAKELSENKFFCGK